MFVLTCPSPVRDEMDDGVLGAAAARLRALESQMEDERSLGIDGRLSGHRKLLRGRAALLRRCNATWWWEVLAALQRDWMAGERLWMRYAPPSIRDEDFLKLHRAWWDRTHRDDDVAISDGVTKRGGGSDASVVLLPLEEELLEVPGVN